MSGDSPENIELRLQELTDAIVALAALNFDVKVPVRGDGPFDAIAIGLQMLGEELRAAVTAKQAAEAASRAKSQFLAEVSHELRTPLAGIVTGTELMLAKEASTERLTEVMNAAKTLHQLMNGLLEFANIEAGIIELSPADFSLSDVLSTVKQQHRHAAATKGLRLVFREANLPSCSVHGDGLRVQQVLSNLVGNAIKYTSEGEVVVTADCDVREELARIRFEVADSGMGLDAADLPLLFERFGRGARAKGSSASGLGLGLFISKTLAELMGGSIDAKAGETGGAVFAFSVDLPVHTVDRFTEAVVPQASARPMHSRLLVVEDNATLRRLIVETLSDAGCEVSVASDGKEAVEMFEPGRFDLVLMDCKMPVMDGFEATREIRRAFPEDRTPIIALTAHATVAPTFRFAAYGMDGCLTKPFDTQQLRAVVHQFTSDP